MARKRKSTRFNQMVVLPRRSQAVEPLFYRGGSGFFSYGMISTGHGDQWFGSEWLAFGARSGKGGQQIGSGGVVTAALVGRRPLVARWQLRGGCET